MEKQSVVIEGLQCVPIEELNPLSGAVIAAAIEVHRHLGPGFLESVYDEALAVELELRGIAFVRQANISVGYKSHHVGLARLDLLIEEKLIVELKAVDALVPIHKAQVLSYLRATGLPLGLLINFNSKLLREGVQRVILN